jgi:hypothetical protein
MFTEVEEDLNKEVSPLVYFSFFLLIQVYFNIVH